jgi:hypothetical protein
MGAAILFVGHWESGRSNVGKTVLDVILENLYTFDRPFWFLVVSFLVFFFKVRVVVVM